MFTDSDKEQERWKEYIEDLYDKNNKPQEEDIHLETDTDDIKGPPILFSEFEAALSELKMERQGKDGIPALLKALGAKGKRELYDICNEIYVIGELPDDFLE